MLLEKGWRVYPGEFAEQNPDKVAVIMEPSGSSLTFGEYEQRANQFAHLLRSCGLQHGDHLAVLMENNIFYVEVMGGAERSGVWYTPINSYLTAGEVAYIVDNCDAKVFVTSVAKAEVAVEAAAQVRNVQHYFVVDSDQAIGPFRPLRDATAGLPTTPIADESLGAGMFYSSGTTGQPKGIIRPLPRRHPAETTPLVAAVSEALLGYRRGMTYLSPAPLYHTAPQAAVSASLRLEATAIVMERFDPELYLQLVDRYHVTHSQLVPTMFSRLLKLPEEVRARYDISSLEQVVHAAAPCPPQVKRDMIAWWGPIVREYYGATEGNGITMCTAEEWLERPGTVGRPFTGELHILDETGAECGIGEPGVIWFGGSAEFEYYKDRAKTEEHKNADTGLSYVGDMGYVDEDGYLYLTDRITFMIVSGGVNVYPQEAENLLITHPKVLDAAVFGVPNDDLGEEVKAVVQLVDGVAPTDAVAQELIQFCRRELAGIKCPRTVDFMDELPRLPTGKLYKRVLRDSYWGDRTSRIL